MRRASLTKSNEKTGNFALFRQNFPDFKAFTHPHILSHFNTFLGDLDSLIKIFLPLIVRHSWLVLQYYCNFGAKIVSQTYFGYEQEYLGHGLSVFLRFTVFTFVTDKTSGRKLIFKRGNSFKRSHFMLHKSISSDPFRPFIK